MSGILPREASMPLAEACARIFLLFPSRFKKYVNSNLTGNFNRPDLTKQFCLNYFTCFTDLSKVTNISKARLNKILPLKLDKTRIDYHLQRGNGLIALTPRLGFWELTPAIFSLNGYRTNSIYGPSAGKELPKPFKSTMRKDINWIPVDAASQEGIKALRRNEILTTSVDDDRGAHSIELPFLNADIRISVRPALLSYLTGAPIMLCYTTLLPGKVYKAEMEEVIYPNRSYEKAVEVERICTEILLNMESRIRQRPDQWFIFKEESKP